MVLLFLWTGPKQASSVKLPFPGRRWPRSQAPAGKVSSSGDLLGADEGPYLFLTMILRG
jgi:hypothetical protein